VAKVCSKEKMPLALVSSNGFAYQFLSRTRNEAIPDKQVYLARSTKCREKTEQFWFVPENAPLDYEEIILAQKVNVKRLLGDFYDNPDSRLARKEFADNIKKFIEELKNNPKAEGFIIRNIKTKAVYLKKALQQIQKERIDRNRVQTLKKKIYESNFPEFITISVDK
jgi:hypothetical protein